MPAAFFDDFSDPTSGWPVADTDVFARWLLESFSLDGETLMVAPGAGFYATPGAGKSEIRIAYVLNIDDLRRALRVLQQGIEEYQKTGRLLQNLGG